MKKRILKSLLAIFILLLSMVGKSWAESINLTVSCTIPAIPGVNSPPFPKEKTSADKNAGAEEEIKEEKTTQNEAPALIQEETIKDARLVKTFYSR